MDKCTKCGKPIDFGDKHEQSLWKIDKMEKREKKIVTVRCPDCGTWNSKEVEK
jgi:DNA-directed RNA polymerase subunit RPC12/RpoP